MFGSDYAMYMNEQLIHRPGKSVITKQTALRKSDTTKVSRFLGLLAAVVLVLIVSLCAPMLGGEQDALAATNNGNTVLTVEIEKGDTLWSLAGKYAHKGQDVREYIHEMKILNGLKSNVLQEGQVLQLP
jgi:LysM repeat protein